MYEDNWLVGSTSWVWYKKAQSPAYPKVDGWTVYSADTPSEFNGQPLGVYTCFIAIKDGGSPANIDAMLRDHNVAQSLDEIIDCIGHWNETGMRCCQR